MRPFSFATIRGGLPRSLLSWLNSALPPCTRTAGWPSVAKSSAKFAYDSCVIPAPPPILMTIIRFLPSLQLRRSHRDAFPHGWNAAGDGPHRFDPPGRAVVSKRAHVVQCGFIPDRTQALDRDVEGSHVCSKLLELSTKRRNLIRTRCRPVPVCIASIGEYAIPTGRAPHRRFA